MPADASTPSQLLRRRIVEWSDPGTLTAAGQTMDGLAFLRALIAGALPPPPVIALLGIDLVTAEAGCVTFRMEPGEHLYNPLGSVHGGMIATLLDTALSCAVHSTLSRGRAYTTLEIKVNCLRAVTVGSGPVTAVGQVIHTGRRQAVADARLTDGRGRLCATANTTCLVFDQAAPAHPAAEGGL